MNNKKVVVGMSGGVDSSVAAYLLKKEGYDVVGVTMQIWQDEDETVMQEEGGCCGLSAVDDARRVAQMLDIPYYVMNFKEDFKKYVMDYFASEYLAGRTPNPCIACNRYVKWQSLLKRSMDIGAEYIATGHYARVIELPSGRYALHTSKTSAKDQTYALYNLTQDQLAHTLMPVGAYTKDEIRHMASEIGLSVASKPDSQEICFIPDHDYASFIEQYTGKKMPVGNFVSVDGEVLGRHKGITHYTVGQRKGLGIAFGEPMFVKEIRPDSNEVVLARTDEVWSDTLHAMDFNWMAYDGTELDHDGNIDCVAKIRYSHQGERGRVSRDSDGRIKVVFEKPVRAITPGQAVVLYTDEGIVIGGGTII